MKRGYTFCGALATAVLMSASCSNHDKSLASSDQGMSASTPLSVEIPATSKKVHAEQIDKTWPSHYQFQSTSIDKKHDAGIRPYEISAEFPQITRVQTRETNRFNRWMAKKIRAYVAEFTELQERAERQDRRRGLPRIHITERLAIYYTMYFSDEDLISLRLTQSVMAIGQMHPIDYYETINFDLKRGRVLRARDIFRRGYLTVFSDYSRKTLEENYAISTDEWFEKGTAPKVSNFPNWNIVPDGILISFEDYQVGPHSFGQPELIVPFRELERVLRNQHLSRLSSGPTSSMN